MSWPLLDAGADAAEEAVVLVFGRVAIQKRRADAPDPLTKTGFEGLLRQMFRELVGATAGVDHQAVIRGLQILDVDWPKLSKVQRERAVESAMRALGGVPDIVIPRVQSILGESGRVVVEGTKRGTAARYDLQIASSFNVVDRRVIDHAVASQAHYIRDEYGRRDARYSAVARDVVARGLEQGHDRYEIGKALAGALDETSAKRNASYYQLVASIFMARSRTFATLTSFHEAGIEYSEWSSTLDEVTSDICRFMDGRILRVGAAIGRFEQVAAATDPEAVKELQPFAGVAEDDEGNRALYYKRAGERRPLARIVESGVGQVDERGTFSHAASDKQIQDAGIMPPAHGHCRSLLVPHSGAGSTVQVPATVIPAAPPTKSPITFGGPRRPPRAPPPAPPAVSPPPPPPAPVAGPAAPPPPKPPPPTATPSPSAAAPAPRQPQLGVHVLAIKTTKVAAVQLERILSAIDEAGILDILAKHPVAELVVKPTIASRNANGSYVMFGRGVGTLDLRSKRRPGSFGLSMKPGGVWSVSNCAKDETEAIRRTLVHELGHHLHRVLGAPADHIIKDAYFQAAQATLALGGKQTASITHYSITNRLEYFSESFAAYVFERAVLAAHDPGGLAMVEAVLKLGGMP